ncbi:hypothetical protein BP5796_01613 [Coleophoma crateriformis]|uniref:Transcription factor TFIIIC triple barrel domain-containing protein n=1 Tax=Coleophoma crateriformis TaxID=565419 RepID=A0A3D8T142_9HELO|nr:hypothetical protein BP5796_01613 [Coleophoma crateriformis]
MAYANLPSFAIPIDPALDGSPSSAIPTPRRVEEATEEWEYEYSTTETETYYVTLDLTTPAIAQQKKTQQNRGGGTGKVQWVMPPALQAARSNKSKLPEAEQVQESTPVPGTDGGQLQKAADRVGEVQILDLDTEHPVVSFGGIVYSCRWEENIGTELLFKEHNPNDPLPVLRNLPEGVDLLAASSARIVSEQIRLDRKARSPSPEPQKGSDARILPGANLASKTRIPIGQNASEQRKDQARFLERMIELKRKKGEEDAVTVVAGKRKTRNQWLKVLSEERKKERTKLQKATKRGGKTAEKARERLDVMDEEDEEKRTEAALKDAARGREKRIIGRPKKQTLEDAERLPTLFEQQQHSFGVSSAMGSVEGSQYGGTATMPTPQQWSDGEDDDDDAHLGMGMGMENAYDQQMYGEDDGDASYQAGHNKMYDIDAPGEDDDTQMQYGWQ